MITMNHPFAHTGGETMFVAPELEQVTRSGLRVRIAPLYARGQRFDLPPGSELDLGLARSLARNRLFDFLRAPFWPGFAAELTRALKLGGLVGVLRVWRWAAVAQAAWRWARTLPAGEPLLAYTYWRGGATMAMARIARERPRMATLTRVHGYELYEERFRPPFQPWTDVYAQMSRVVTVSQHGLDYLRVRGVGPSALMLSRLGVDAPAAPTRTSHDGVLRVLSCSFMQPVKRVPLLARAMVSLARRQTRRQVHWTHLGGGPDMTAVRDALADSPTTLDVNLPGNVVHAVVRAHYAQEAVDVFVLVSESEGLPVSVQEALAAGVPVVATDVGGVREAVDSTVGRLLGPDPSPEEIADAVIAVTGADHAALREAARARWSQAFDARRNHAAFVRELQRLAAVLEQVP